MAAPYRANYQHKVKAPTSEASKMSAERALIGVSLQAVQKSNRRIAKKSITKRCRSGMLCTAFVAKKCLSFLEAITFFIQIIFRELGNQF